MALAVGETVRRRREQLGLSQEKFAERCGLHRTYIGFLERGERTPNIETLAKVAAVMRRSASSLLREAGF